jgi:precorrin-3B C17-methyltransferase
LLTPWDIIEKRLRAAAAGDFSICVYNPGSHGRQDSLHRACDILLETLPAERICGITHSIGRDGENAEITSLGELRDIKPDMNMTVFIGSSRTRALSGKMVTPRGYSLET